MIVEINSVNYGSTGNIARNICNRAREKGENTVFCYSNRRSTRCNKVDGDILIGTKLSFYIHEKLTMLTGLHGCFSIFATIKLIRHLAALHPEIVHLHNLHSSFINIPLLFNYLGNKNINVVWTLHDCWAFTGKCTHFSFVNCMKWKEGCSHCPQITDYPTSFIDCSRILYKLKKNAVRKVHNLTIVTPSQWLAGLVKDSFLGDYPIKVINNGIDVQVFKPHNNVLKQKYNIEQKYIVLGVASEWSDRKGLDVLIQLSKDLDDNYQVIIIGDLPDNKIINESSIITVGHTTSKNELADFYSIADVFVNPTREDTFPTVNIEALACGVPVLTYKTGGSPEMIDDTCGSVVPYNDYNALKAEIHRICETKPYEKLACLAKGKQYDMNDRFDEYLRLFERIKNH